MPIPPDVIEAGSEAGRPFAWSEEHDEFRQFLRKKLQSLGTVEAARARLDDPTRPDAAWRVLCAELGIAGLTLPEEHGGSGFGRVEQAIVAEELGRALVGGPYLPTVVLAGETILRSGDADLAARLLPGIAEGATQAALAVAEGSPVWDLDGIGTTAAPTASDGWALTGRKSAVIGAAEADVLLVVARAADGPGLFVVEPGPGVAVHVLEALDATRPIADVDLTDATATRVGIDPLDLVELVEVVRAGAATFLAVEQAGGSAACVELTTAYAKDRIQFGVPIGRFQGVKHRLADMQVRTSLSYSAAIWAAWQVPGSPESAMGASVARAYCSEAFVQTAFDTVQLHGGIAITWEHDAHLYLRRAQSSAALLGRPSDERARLVPHVEAEVRG